MGFTLAALIAPSFAYASHDPNHDACRASLDWNAWREQRLFRAHLFGVKRARDAAVSEVRFAVDKSVWIKTQAGAGATSSSPLTVDEWRSLSPGYENITWYNPIMDSQGDIRPRTGIFETREKLSSELVPYITQAYRTFECRAEAVCRLLELSDRREEHTPQSVIIDVPGCRDIPARTYVACHREANESPVVDQGSLREYCRTMIMTLRRREEQVTRMVVEYDAGYRSVLQLSGILRTFMGEMRGTVLGSLRSTANLIASFSRIPCFIGSCDDAPASIRTPFTGGTGTSGGSDSGGSASATTSVFTASSVGL